MTKRNKLVQRLKDNREELPESVRIIRRRVKIQAITMLASVFLVLVLGFAMTAAWYTNVAKTSDLTFETEVWGFDEAKISLPEETDVILAAPGTSGIVPISIDNSDSTDSVKISVMISKLLMEDEELKKRIFFYADAPTRKTFGIEEEMTFQENGKDAANEEEAGEMMSRVYIGASESDCYTYTIFPGQKLVLSDSFYNDVPIKWEWVYDMVGYYFLGTVNEELMADETGAVTADEYIRPITYDYSEAVFDVALEVQDPEDEEGEEALIDNVNYGQLLRIGQQTREEFLQELTAVDGYPGVIDEDTQPVILEANTEEEANTVEVVNEETGEITEVFVDPEPQRLYYPIDVDENGYGVWAYLCTRNEIKEAIAYDTAIQAAEEKMQAKATIVLTAVNVPTEALLVGDAQTLTEALADPTVDALELNTDLSLDSTVEMTGTDDKLINLNGYSISYTGVPSAGEKTTHMFSVQEGTSLTLLNGSLNCESEPLATTGGVGNAALESIGGEVTLSGVTVTGFDTIINIKDMEAEGNAGSNESEEDEEVVVPTLDSTVKVVNCAMDAAQIGILLQGNGKSSEALTKLIIQDSTITGGYMGISGQGNDDRSGTELVIIGSKINGYYAALYHPQKNSKVMITGRSELSGYTGIAIKGGTMTVEDSVVRGTGEYAPAAASGSGFIDTGDGIYMEAVYNWGTTVILKGENQILSDKAYAIDLYGQESKGPGKILVYNGTFTGAKGSAVWNGIGIFEIYGGIYSGDLDAPAETPIVRYDIEEEETI